MDNNLEDLKKEIVGHAQKYYEGEPDITDQEFDNLYMEYLKKDDVPSEVPDRVVPCVK